MASDFLHQFVDMALPKPCSFGEENFAGDPLVRTFCDWLIQRHKIDLNFFVSWACPPEVMIVRTAAGNAVIRSERFDTLLVEYYNFQRLHPMWSNDLGREVTASGVLRWMCEFFIGYRCPELAVLAQQSRPKIADIKLTSPYRDEALSSVPELERVALQCTCLAHEIGHILMPRRPEVSLEEVVDGISLARHIEWGNKKAVQEEKAWAALRTIWQQNLNGPTLLSEVEADLFAFASVIDFLCNTRQYSLEEAIRAALRSFEAHLFVFACKKTCRLLAKSFVQEVSKIDFLIEDYLMGSEYIVRARVVARRAGIVWAVAEQPDAPAGTRSYSSSVERVDAIILETQAFTVLAAGILSEKAHHIFDFIQNRKSAPSNEWFDETMASLDRDADLKYDIWEILIAFGCHGGTNVIEYLKGMRSQRN